MATSKKASKKAARKVAPKAEPKPEPVADEVTKPISLGTMASWPVYITAKDPRGQVRTLKVFPGVDGPYCVDDGEIVQSQGYKGWERLT